MFLEAGCEITYELMEPTPLFLLLRPQSGASQQVLAESLALTPPIPVFAYSDSFGNACQRCEAPAGRLEIVAHARAEVSPTIDVHPGAPHTSVLELPAQVIEFLMPSRYCPSDQLGDEARQIVADVTLGYDQVEAIRHWIHTNVEYCYGTSTGSTSALETFTKRRGVCRDFAHLGIALCRGLDIPARMVTGYFHQLKPMDMHAWFEAYVAGRWYTFDATQAEPREGRIVIAYGRDAADVALTIEFGPATLSTMRVWVNEVRSEV
ncbi:MAG: transglutaminase family protein [Acidobacteria bacterium]|nr:transglutaminase family protein [Acidobacteriota bacterium]